MKRLLFVIFTLFYAMFFLTACDKIHDGFQIIEAVIFIVLFISLAINIGIFIFKHFGAFLILVVVLIAGSIFAIYMYSKWEDKDAYQTAKEQNTEASWENYRIKHPFGDHINNAKEALTAIRKQKDEAACRKAEENNGYGWKNYLKEFPAGACSDKANSRLAELRHQSGISFNQNKPDKDLKSELMWSNELICNEDLQNAINYCQELSLFGYSDWRLPNIDELRTLIQHCPETEINGKCKVSAKNECLNSSCWYPENSCSCSPDENERYNKLEYVQKFWSSSLRSDGDNFAWYLDFSKGSIDTINTSYTYPCFLCTRGRSNLEKTLDVEQDNEYSDGESPERSDNNILQWSAKSAHEMNWQDAINYCTNLNENNHHDWRLPNIDELRTLVIDRKTMTGGACKVSNRNNCLSYKDCFVYENCAESCDKETDKCSGYNDGRYSILGDIETLWSASPATDQNLKSFAWTIRFLDGYLSLREKSKEPQFARCVR